MRNLLAGSLMPANAENRQRVRTQLVALAEQAAKDFLTEDENMERMALEEELERLNKEAEELRARGRTRASPKAATERLIQEHHDARYRMARAKGVAHPKAWKAEKVRRRAATNRRQGIADRATSRLEHKEAWTKHFREGGEERPQNRQDLQRERDAHIPTVVVDKECREAEPSSRINLRPLTRKEKTYIPRRRRRRNETVVSATVYTKKKDFPQEARQMMNKKRNERRKRVREKYAEKGKGKGSHNKRRRARQQEDEEEEDETWGTWKPDDPDRDPEDKGKDWWKDDPGSGRGSSVLSGRRSWPDLHLARFARGRKGRGKLRHPSSCEGHSVEVRKWHGSRDGNNVPHCIRWRNPRCMSMRTCGKAEEWYKGRTATTTCTSAPEPKSARTSTLCWTKMEKSSLKDRSMQSCQQWKQNWTRRWIPTTVCWLGSRATPHSDCKVQDRRWWEECVPESIGLRMEKANSSEQILFKPACWCLRKNM